jgi:hypothetical protein
MATVHVAPTVATSDFPPPLLLRKFSVAEYHLMLEVGIFVSGDPYELLEGWIVEKPKRSPPHETSRHLVLSALFADLPDSWVQRTQSTITTQDSEPEPDNTIVRGAPRDYLPHHPYPADIGLLVEVADTSLAHDRTIRGRIYARAGISPYWIVNLIDAQVEVYSAPSGNVAAPAYQQLQTFRPGQVVPFLLDGQQIAAIPVQDLLP